MQNFLVSIPATIDLEVQAKSENELLQAIKDVLADFNYAINVDIRKYAVTDEWSLKSSH